MARSLEAGITRLERRQRREYEQWAQEVGMTVEEMLDEAEAWLSQPLEVKLAEVEALAAESEAQGLPWPEFEWIKATLIREHRSCG
jgi:hypothetical protein